MIDVLKTNIQNPEEAKDSIDKVKGVTLPPSTQRVWRCNSVHTTSF